MESVIVTIFTTMIGTFFGWLLAQVKLGCVKVIVKDKHETFNYQNDDTGEISEYSKGKFCGVKFDMRLLISNTKERDVALRDFEAVFYAKNGRVILSVPLKDAATMTYHPYGIEAKTVQCIIVDAGSSIDINLFCFVSDYEKVKEIELIKVKYLNSKLREKYCEIEKVNYFDLEEYRTQEE